MRGMREPLSYIGPGTQGITDENLALSAAGGDMRALEELFHRYEGPVVGYLQRLIRDGDVAEDLSRKPSSERG